VDNYVYSVDKGHKSIVWMLAFKAFLLKDNLGNP